MNYFPRRFKIDLNMSVRPSLCMLSIIVIKVQLAIESRYSRNFTDVSLSLETILIDFGENRFEV